MAGSYNFKVVPTGQKTPVYLNVNQTFHDEDPLSPYTFAVTGLTAQVQAYVFSDDRLRPRRGFSAFRFVHLSPDAPAVDVRFDGQMKPVFTNIKFGSASTYQEITRGDYTIQFLETGTAHVLAEGHIRLLADVPTSVYVEGTVAGKNVAVEFSRDL